MSRREDFKSQMDKEAGRRDVGLHVNAELPNSFHLSGFAVLSSNQHTLLVNNLTTGQFDCYDFPEHIPSISLPVSSTRRIVKQCAFTDQQTAVCGSDNGHVYIFNIETGNCLQKLPHGKGAMNACRVSTVVLTNSLRK